MRSNSVIASRSIYQLCVSRKWRSRVACAQPREPLVDPSRPLVETKPDEIERIEQAMSRDGRHEVVGFLIQKRQQDRQGEQREKDHQIGMHQREQKRTD